MASLNRVILVGRITKTPELKKTTTGLSVTSFSIAIDNLVKAGAEKTASFIPCTSWNKTAELISKYCGKGSLVAVEGRLSQRTYEDKNNTRRSVIEVVVDNIQFLQNKSDDTSRVAEETSIDNNTSIQEGIDSADDDLPF